MEKTHDYFSFSAKIALWVLVALLPIWFVPYPIGIEFGREITFAILISIALILWLLSLLTRGEMRFVQSPILGAGALLIAVFGVSTFLSQSPFVSLALAGPIGERLLTLVFAFVLMFLVGAVAGSWREVSVGLWLLFGASATGALLALIQLLFDVSPWGLIASFADARDFNVVGTINGFALFLAVIAASEIGVLLSPASARFALWKKILLAISIIFSVAVLFAVNFLTAWIVFLGGVIVLWGFLIKDLRAHTHLDFQPPASSIQPPKFNWRYAIALGLVALSLFMVIVRAPIGPQLNLPAEVSPTLGGTWNVSLRVLREGAVRALFGSGPGTFGFSWAKYKDPTINQTAFWEIRFNQGSSWFSTLVSTSGILGTLAFLGFLGTTLFVFLRVLLANGRVEVLPETDIARIEEDESPYPIGVVVGIAALALSAFLYPANPTLMLLLFLMIGWMGALVKIPYSSQFVDGSSQQASTTTDYELPTTNYQLPASFWAIRERVIQFVSPWSLFLSSLAGILCLAIAISSLYFQIGRARSAFVVQRGITLLNQGQIDDALLRFERAIIYEDRNVQNYLVFVQGSMQKIQQLIQRASRQENVQQEFQTTVAGAVARARRAAELQPQEPIVWRTQGSLYELIIPFVDGAYNAATASYGRAAELDPLNPLPQVDIGRAGLVLADRIALASNQASQDAHPQLQKAYADALETSRVSLKKAIEIKPDLAGAHFLMTQVSIRAGNPQDAISSAEQARAGAPFDLGVAFQLGLLYYQAERYDQAQAEFERAVAISENYSNARYFLGLILDRKGEKDAAIKQFEKIEALNPENQEVKKILENLRAGKPGLETIVPPAEPPEERTSEPIKEGTTQKR